jgi:UDP-N-acetylglucosamine transferase subunit ALG13
VIFVTIGSHEPFDRLVKAVDLWASKAKPQDLFGQITSNGTYKPEHFKWVPYLDPASFNLHMARARLIVAHAGMGSIITAMDLNKPIVIMPRRGHLNETRNDHQYASAKKFVGKPGIFVAENETQIASTIEQALSAASSVVAQTASPFAQPQLLDFLRSQFER